MLKVLSFMIASFLFINVQTKGSWIDITKECDKDRCPLKECAKLVLMDQKGLTEALKAMEVSNPSLVISIEKTEFTCDGPDIAIVKRFIKVISPLKIEPILTGITLNISKPLCEKFIMNCTIIKDLNPEFNGFSYKDAPTIDLLEFHLCTEDE